MLTVKKIAAYDFYGDGDFNCDDWNLFVQAWTGPGPPPLLRQCADAIPTVSEWGLIVMLLILFTLGKLVFSYRRPVAA